MKKIILKTGVAFLLLFIMGAGCEKEDNEDSDFVNGYIVGSFLCDETNCATQTQRGFCILLENSEQENAASGWGVMDFYTFDLPPNIFDFPDEILLHHNPENCGPAFFPESLRNKYKINFRYKKSDENIQFAFGCTDMLSPFPWRNYDLITVKNVKKY